MNPELIFQLRSETSSETELSTINAERSDENQEMNNILCVLWKSNKLGAAYYSLSDNLLYVYEEYIDSGPQFLILKCLYREVLPKFTICIGTSTDLFIQSLIDTMNDQSTNSMSDIRSLPPNFSVLSMKEYPYEICKCVLQNAEISSFNEAEPSETLKEMYMQSLINFDSKMSVYAAGSLIKYLDKNWASFSPDQELKIMYIHQVTLNILLNPTFNMTELNKRLDFIQFALHPTYKEYIESLQDNIKHIVDISTILLEIQNSKAKSSSWQTLNKTILHTILINELSGPHRHKSELLSELKNSISPEFIGLHQSIQDAFDFSTKFKGGRPVIKFGIDADLDAKKLRRKDIAKYLTAAARVAVESLPDHLTECAVVYLPEMGHLVAVKEWEPDCNPEQLADIGYEFKFTVGGTIHYKSALCLELDAELGDINAEIIAHENRIIQRLSGFVMKHNKDIREPLKIVAMIDSLIALARVAEEKNFVKPTLNNERIQEIVEGRHPLIEEMFSGFVSNDFYSGGKHSHMKIITGPNGSGKSIYLKQIGIIIYLAHIGSYLPVKHANIGIVHSIHFRIATESVSVRLSAFMIDVTQITQAIYNAKPSSLIIMDEFGKGTSGEDGVVLMAGVLRKFLRERADCPHVLVSTHYQQILGHLPTSPILDYQKMSHTINEAEKIVLLYKLTQGVSDSFAFDVAEEAGLDRRIIDRAKEIYDCLKNNVPIRPRQMSTTRIVPPDIPSGCLHNFLANVEIPRDISGDI